MLRLVVEDIEKEGARLKSGIATKKDCFVENI